MSLYLQRLLARTGGAPVPLAFGAPTPVSALASPLAEHDQRLGLPEFGGAALEEGLPPEPSASAGEGDRTVPKPFQVPRPQPRPVEAAPAPFPEADPPVPVEVLRQPPPAARGAGGDEPAPATVPREVDLSFPPPRPFDIAEDDFEPLPPAPPPLSSAEPEPAPGSESEAAALRLPVPDAAPAATAAAERAAQAGETAPESRSAPPQPREAQPAPRSPAERHDVETRASAGIEPEPMPAERPEQDRAEPFEAGPATPVARARVATEQVVVEVRDPVQSAPSGREGRSRAMPATAAAASMIGPLPVRRSAVTLYGMRRR
jgi:hypothetical protein